MRSLILCAILCTSLCGSADAASSDLRRLPFPFGQMVTISSDADYEAPWHEAAIHRFLNEDLGLPISDSVWVSSSSGLPDVGAFFESFSGLNRQPSLVDNLPVFELLTREWHRGNIDHLHSWSDDMVPQYKATFPEPVKLSRSSTEVSLPDAPWLKSFEHRRGYQQLRLLLDGTAPQDLTIEVRFADGTSSSYTNDVIRSMESDGDAKTQTPRTITLVLNEEWPLGSRINDVSAPLPAVTALLLRAPSCTTGCDTRITGIERDNFSRYSVLAQIPFLEYMNIRPSIATGHGGVTYHPDFEGPGPHYHRGDLLDQGPGKDVVRRDMEGLAARKGSDAYHADILKKLGIRSVTAIYNPPHQETVNFASQIPAAFESFAGFYALVKTHGDFGALGSPLSDVPKMLAELDPAMADFDAQRFLCRENVYCRQADQGSTSGGLIALSLALVSKGRTVEHNWYTHFGTTRFDPTFHATTESPFGPATMAAFAELSMHYYDPTANHPFGQRVWVPAAGVWANYNILRTGIGDHLTVDPHTSAVQIRSYFDPVLGTVFPDRAAGTRDLNGLTVFVKDSSVATVSIDGEPITYFVRNPADESGRQSITVVDDNTPTIILGKVAPEHSARISSTGGQYEWISGQESSGPSAFARLIAQSNVASVSFGMNSLSVFNATHIAFSYRIRRDDGAAPSGHASIVFKRADATHVEFTDVIPPALAPGNSYAIFDQHNSGQQWQSTTIPQHSLRWSEDWVGRRLPLVLGRIESVEVQLKDARPGDILEVGDLKTLRPSANGVSQNQTVVAAGRVTGLAGKAAAGVTVTGDFDGLKRQTVTDAAGFYVFSGVKRGSIAAIKAGSCAPTRGDLIELEMNEVEIDIDLRPFS
ncbi:carboxypeptidase-like regulatory domain-containing protein [Bradyrhizobium erythrophlei]|uniref:Carboxypeptidase regulatory-like domain-containing protein n=1 Tax=Bradyrhizobium erythrophlei TaxID=1437360 RepID=A0A1H5HUB5_9BRAD|nr:carboxypeptidase-like regulatory domain-containing protein [Bradyrhizobium erythrophlei]SEE30828.1 hypothetical protein SAMN05444164_7616 [Bradyrhizobium erythrophlei]